MKTRSIIAAIAMMAIVPTASAQQEIKEAFADVLITDGVTVVGEHKTAKEDANSIAIESNVTTIKVKGRNNQSSVFNMLKNAFKKESSNTSMFEEEMGGETNEIDSALVHDLGLRRQWSIWRDGSDAVLIGSMKNSSYYIANFNDKKNDGYRTCYAAEWSNADDPEVYTAKLVYVYGQQPKTAHGIASVEPINIMGSASLRDRLDDLKDRLKGLNQMPDGDFTSSLDSLFNRSLKNVAIGSFRLDSPTDIPFDGNMDSWMALVMQRGVSNLSNADWHRFFGLLTQQMMDKGNKESKEDLIVSAGLILDLRKVAANRLLQVSEYFDDDKNQYVFDMIELARKKVEKQK